MAIATTAIVQISFRLLSTADDLNIPVAAVEDDDGAKQKTVKNTTARTDAAPARSDKKEISLHDSVNYHIDQISSTNMGNRTRSSTANIPNENSAAWLFLVQVKLADIMAIAGKANLIATGGGIASEAVAAMMPVAATLSFAMPNSTPLISLKQILETSKTTHVYVWMLVDVHKAVLIRHLCGRHYHRENTT